MKYSLRTVVWRFKETTEELPDVIPLKQKVIIRTPGDIYALYRPLFADHVRERFVVFWLAANNMVLGFEVVTEGTINASLAHPREIFRGAIVASASSIILAHNHPSGSLEPSREDIEITRQTAEAGRIVGIRLHDHIIATQHSYISLAERGLM
jgi:DNA repair protein RadC